MLKTFTFSDPRLGITEFTPLPCDLNSFALKAARLEDEKELELLSELPLRKPHFEASL